MSREARIILPQREGPLRLLDLPVDILRCIINEITYSSDLTSLALTSSTLHSLVIPYLYNRVDIFWPASLSNTTESKSVDALTYGLSTLCLGSQFARTVRRLHDQDAPYLSKFKGNDYAKYTRKFSIGNGPAAWTNEYDISREGGKMLGTLVALAVAKMVKLETFVWDMPTGVLSDIFMALGSLAKQNESKTCNLERVWVRWHDNAFNSSKRPSSPNSTSVPGASSSVVPQGSTLTPIGVLSSLPDKHATPKSSVPYAHYHVEYPTFSVLPPLKALTVLDIDELSYLDEMADLIARSAHQLQELRVSIAATAGHKVFVQAWDGSTLQQVDHAARWPGESTIGDRRLGGVLGVLVGKIYDIQRRVPPKNSQKGKAPLESKAPSSTSTPEGDGPEQPSDDMVIPSPTTESLPLTTTEAIVASHATGRKRLEGKLKLQTLALERVPLSIHVCRCAIDWTVLSHLTILGCDQHEAFWKMLRKQYEPTPTGPSYGIPASNKLSRSNAPRVYHLQLKRIHTDTTSRPLIKFLTETLAPNSLEVLFLQDFPGRSSGPPDVPITSIKCALKRHRSSLRKLLLDSGNRPSDNNAKPPVEANSWRHWVLPTDMVKYMTSGRMRKLRELAVSLARRDWHFFLQRLPNLPQLRSLNIAHLHHAPDVDAKELAMQMIDIGIVRPELRISYIGLLGRCFEVLEVPNGSTSNGATKKVEDDEDETEEEEGGDEEGLPAHGLPVSDTDPDDTQSEHSVDDDSDDDSFIEDHSPKVLLKLREILFYDDKVAIFKARHATL